MYLEVKGAAMDASPSLTTDFDSSSSSSLIIFLSLFSIARDWGGSCLAPCGRCSSLGGNFLVKRELMAEPDGFDGWFDSASPFFTKLSCFEAFCLSASVFLVAS